ncbi:MAG: transposase, partial [Hornefia sp.]|nr:transposase [Hornefia sp.]
FEVKHTPKELSDLSSYIEKLDGETRIVMECTGHYHEPILKVLSDAGLSFKHELCYS